MRRTKTSASIENDFERAIARRLREAGARPAYIRRFIEELRDHREEAEASARETNLDVLGPSTLGDLGDVDTVVEAALRDPRVLQWARRWPAIVFGLLAALAIPSAFAVTALLLIGMVEGLDRLFDVQVGTPAFSIFHSAAALYIDTARMVFPPALAVAYCLIARRAHLDARWLILSAICLVTVSMATTFPFEISDEGREASLSLDIEQTQMLSRWRNAIPVATPFATIAFYGWIRKESRESFSA